MIVPSKDKNYEKGIKHYEKRQFEKAIGFFKKSIKKDSTFPDAYAFVGVCYIADKRPHEALSWIDKAIEKDPRRKEFRKYREDCEKAIALDPKSAVIKDIKPGTVKRKVSPPRREIKGSRKDSPFPPLFGIALVLHTAKKVSSDINKEASNIANFLGRFKIDEYIMLQIDYVAMYYAITDQITLHETLQEITDLSAKLMYFSIKDPIAFDIFNEALGYVSKSQYEKGIKLLEKAIKLSPNNPMYMADLFKTYQQTGNINKANEIGKVAQEMLSNLRSEEYQKIKFEEAKQRLSKEMDYFQNVMKKYQDIIADEKGIISLISGLTSEIVSYLKGDKTKLKDLGIVVDDCLHCFELFSVVASVVFFKLHFKLGDDQLFSMIKNTIIEILGWEPEPLPKIQTPNFLSPQLRQNAWLSTLGMDVMSFNMMDSIKEARYVHIDGDMGNDDPETHVWYSKASADQQSIGKQHKIHTTNERGKIENYLETQLGEPLTIIHDKGNHIVHIDIHVYPPTKDREFGLMVTSGMSERPMNAPPDAWKLWPIDISKVPEEKREVLSCKYAELIVKLPPDWPLPQPDGKLQNDEHLWVIEELHHLIYYVHRERQWFWDGHSMRSRDDGSLTFAPNTKLAGWIFVYPPQMPPTFGMLKISESKVICFLQIVPVYIEEIQYAMQYNTRRLIDKFREVGIPDYIDINRKNTCL